MYTIYLDDELLYAPNLVNDGYAITAGVLTQGLNKAGDFKFTIPFSNPRNSDIHLLKSVLVIYDDGVEIFRGRPLHVSREFYNSREIYCEGWLACLLDSIVRPYSSSSSVEAKLRTYIAQHNAQVEADKQFIVQTVTVTDPNDYIVRASSDYPQTWHEIENKLIKLLGGYIRYERRQGQGAQAGNWYNYIDYIEDYDRVSDQVIEFGKNLLSFDEFLTAEDLYTVIIPLGARDEETGERLTIKSVNNGDDFLMDDDAVAIFGKIWRPVTWDDVTIASNLKTKGQAELENNLAASVSITMRAFDLHTLDVETDSFQVGDKVRVVSLPHSVDGYFMCSAISRDLLAPDNSVFTFGADYKTLTGQTHAQNQAINGEMQSIINRPPEKEVIPLTPISTLWGDVNGDGVVDQDDLQAIAEYRVGLYPPDQFFDVSACDYNGDGEVTNEDLIYMSRLIQDMPADKTKIVKIVWTYSDGSTFVEWGYQ